MQQALQFKIKLMHAKFNINIYFSLEMHSIDYKVNCITYRTRAVTLIYMYKINLKAIKIARFTVHI